MIPRFTLVLAMLAVPASAPAGDGTFGVPPSGILPPPLPTRTAALSEDDLLRTRLRDTTGSVVSRQYPQREPAPNAGNSRPSADDDEPAMRPAPKVRKKPQARRKPVPTVDPVYAARRQAEAHVSGEPVPSYAAQVTAPIPLQPGAFIAQAPVQSAAAAAYQEHAAVAQPQYAVPQQYDAAPQPQYAAQPEPAPQYPSPPPAQPQAAPAKQQRSAAARLSRSGVPCQELRGLFTSPPECR